MYFILVLCLTLRTFGVSLPAETEPRPTISFNSSSSLSNPPDVPGLGIVVHSPGKALNVTSCYLITIQIIKTLALDDYDGDINRQTFSFLEYPGIAVTFSPSDLVHKLKRSYVLFGIVGGVNHLIFYRAMNEMIVDIMLRSDKVGWIRYVKTESHTLTATGSKMNLPQNLETTDRVLPNDLTTVTDNIDLSDPLNRRFRVYMNYVGGPLPLPGLIVGALTSMWDLSQYSRTEHIRDIDQWVLREWNIKVVIENIPGRPFTSPPFLEYEWLIKTIATVPKYMYSQRRFNELSVAIELDGELVGFVGFLKRDSDRQIASTSRYKQSKVETS